MYPGFLRSSVFLLLPDLHIAWHGDDMPFNPSDQAVMATGYGELAWG